MTDNCFVFLKRHVTHTEEVETDMKETANSIYTKGLSIVLRHLVQNHVNVNEHPENFEFPQFLSGKHLLFFQTNQYYLINALLCILN